MKQSTKGTINEKRAIIYFLKKGCVVCKNVEHHGPYDISVTHPKGDTELLDVKTYLKRKRDGYPIHRNLTALQKKLGVKLFYIDENMEGHYHPPKGVTVPEIKRHMEQAWIKGYRKWKAERDHSKI